MLRIPSFVGRKVLITGASSGLGANLAYTLFRAGAKVAFTSRSLDRAHEIKKNMLIKLEKDTALSSQSSILTLPSASNLLPFECEVSQSISVDNLFMKVNETLSGIDYAINCAAINQDALLLRAKNQ
jgi:3-oxoacyl-[acyl-carrier protein] reductase